MKIEKQEPVKPQTVGMPVKTEIKAGNICDRMGGWTKGTPNGDVCTIDQWQFYNGCKKGQLAQ